MGWESLVERLEALLVPSWGVELIPLLALMPWMVGGSPQWPPLVGMDVELSPIPKTWAFSFQVDSGMQGALGTLVGRVFGLSSSSFLGRATPLNTSSSEKERYHFTSSLSSITISANKNGPPPAGRLFSSAQCWRALAYATTFSQGISLISLHAWIDSAGNINLHLQRHGSAGGAWRLASLIPNSHVCCGSQKEAHTSLASFLQSSIPGTIDNSVHQSRVWHFLAFHGTHWLSSKTMGSGGILSPSSSEVSSNPLRKEATTGFSSSGSSRSELSPVAPSSPGPAFWSVGWLGAGWSSNCTWWHLLFHSSLLCPWWSLLLDLALSSEWFQVQFSLSISSSRVAAVASAFWWASCTVAGLLSTELSLFPFWGMLLLEEWGSLGWGLTVAADAFSSLYPWWSSREDSTSSSSTGSQGGDPGSLCSL